MKKLLSLLIVLLGSCAIAHVSSAQTVDKCFFPMREGASLKSVYYGPDGKVAGSYVMCIRNIKGDLQNGSLDQVYTLRNAKGELLLKDPSDFTVHIYKNDGVTSTQVSSVPRLTKVSDYIQSGDPSTIPTDLKIGDVLAPSTLYINVAVSKIVITISDRKVVEHKVVDSKKYGKLDCWRITEKLNTKTPFSTMVTTTDTWYAIGYGSIDQTVYDAKGKVVVHQVMEL